MVPDQAVDQLPQREDGVRRRAGVARQVADVEPQSGLQVSAALAGVVVVVVVAVAAVLGGGGGGGGEVVACGIEAGDEGAREALLSMARVAPRGEGVWVAVVGSHGVGRTASGAVFCSRSEGCRGDRCVEGICGSLPAAVGRVGRVVVAVVVVAGAKSGTVGRVSLISVLTEAVAVVVGGGGGVDAPTVATVEGEAIGVSVGVAHAWSTMGLLPPVTGP